MGRTPEQEKFGKDEEPVYDVQTGSFRIGKYEVAQELWQAVMSENPSVHGRSGGFFSHIDMRYIA